MSNKPRQIALDHSLLQLPSNHTQLIGSHSKHNSADVTPADRAHALLDLAIALVESALDILNEHITSDQQLRHQSRLMPGGTVGKHFRHVIETFNAFLLPLQPYSPSSPDPSPIPLEIDYDSLLPSSRRITARSLTACRKATAAVLSSLTAWRDRAGHSLPAEMDRNVRLVAVTPTRQEVGSTIGRELWFCALHAIHHFSMLRTIAVHELSIHLPVEFGTAPSTLLYRGDGWKAPGEDVKVVKARL
ncbi:hypothetical protein BCR39DRAFT_541667, partial [Naematelia encephala]